MQYNAIFSENRIGAGNYIRVNNSGLSVNTIDGKKESNMQESDAAAFKSGGNIISRTSGFGLNDKYNSYGGVKYIFNGTDSSGYAQHSVEQ